MMRLAVEKVVGSNVLPTAFSVIEFGNQRFGAGQDFISSKDFYVSLGCTSYTAIDLNTNMDAIVRDLNQPITDVPPADFITNCGTSEHIFNQYQVFKNMHDLCRVGGVMLHLLPFFPWINHGFYNYNPILFRDMANCNEYDVLYAVLCTRWGQTFDLNTEDYKEKRPVELMKKIEETLRTGEAQLLYVFKKRDSYEFMIPTQYKYQGQNG